MRLLSLLLISSFTLTLGACQASLPNTGQSNPTNTYPNPNTPITLATDQSYPNPQTPPNTDPAYPIPENLPTAAPVMPMATPENSTPSTGTAAPTSADPALSANADLHQPGTYTVTIVSVNKGNMVLVRSQSTEHSQSTEQWVSLVGIITIDTAQANCENRSNDRLVLLTVDPNTRYTLTVIKPDQNDPNIVIGKVVRHDTIDLGLDLVASGLALLNTESFEGRENYVTLESAAKAETLGRWNEPCKFSDAIIGTQQA